jgi:hypothetical protein
MKAGTLGSVCFSFHHHSGTERVFRDGVFFGDLCGVCISPHAEGCAVHSIY